MGFWVKRLLFMTMVIVGAVLVIVYMPVEQQLDAQGNVIEKKSIQTNMAKFYEEFSLVSPDEIKQKHGDYVIPLDMSDESLIEQIRELSPSQLPRVSDFDPQGSFKSRAFAQDSTLMTNASSYVTEEGMFLLWHLNQDFIVRHRFVSQNTVTGMLGELAGAIDSNFPSDVELYYCEDKRVLVITDQQDQVLLNQCRQIDRS
ncbi:TcpQ domain-containing protein [Ningiella sp. W23]|uniref:TcpQ domain-containing protein n=1 Tax=Ningiella sp. W23 TaxID=3023715 RepID=UPI003757DEBC